MTDTEWTSWESRWASAAGPLPDIQARASRETRLHRLAGVAFAVLVAIAALAAHQVLREPEPEVRAIGWMIVAFFGVMSVGYAWLRRRRRLPVDVTPPRAHLSFLENRLRLEQRTAHLVRWAFGALCLIDAAIFPRLVADHSAPALEMGIVFPLIAVFFAASVSAPWWVARRNRPHREEVDRWRRWLDEQQL